MFLGPENFVVNSIPKGPWAFCMGKGETQAHMAGEHGTYKQLNKVNTSKLLAGKSCAH